MTQRKFSMKKMALKSTFGFTTVNHYYTEEERQVIVILMCSTIRYIRYCMLGVIHPFSFPHLCDISGLIIFYDVFLKSPKTYFSLNESKLWIASGSFRNTTLKCYHYQGWQQQFACLLESKKANLDMKQQERGHTTNNVLSIIFKSFIIIL